MFYTEDKEVVKNHLMQAAKRVMGAGKFEGSPAVANSLISAAETVDKWETENRPEPQKRETKTDKK